VLKSLLNSTVSRPVAALGLIGSGSLLIGGITTLIPDSGFAGVLVTVLAALTSLFYIYHLIKGPGRTQANGE
jgi:hypothetical protein